MKKIIITLSCLMLTLAAQSRHSVLQLKADTLKTDTIKSDTLKNEEGKKDKRRAKKGSDDGKEG